MEKISIIGAGAWGTALAQAIAMKGRKVTLWAREDKVIKDIAETRENVDFLPGIKLHEDILIESSLIKAAEVSDIIIIMTPAQHVRSTLQAIRGDHMKGKPVVIGSKGVEIKTGLLMSEVVAQEIPDAVCAIMSGPTFAAEIARAMPSAVTLACENKDVAESLSNAIGCRHIRPYITTDMIGVQIGGAFKNILAVACGIAMGKELGESARAALVTRGIAEMSSLTSAMGGKKETLMGMCGFGDIFLTCTSMQSRNFSLGFELGKGQSLEDLMKTRKAVTEGVHTAKAAIEIGKKYAVELPIAEAVYECLHNDISIDVMIEHMLSRPFKREG